MDTSSILLATGLVSSLVANAGQLIVLKRQKAEADLVEQKEAFEAEKLGYQKQVKDMRQVLRSIALVMDGQVDPFELKPASKWSKAELGKWIIAAVENMNWARQRVDNYIDPKNAVPIAPDPE
jgi:hypothetical protein